MCQSVLRYSLGLIQGALPHFHNPDCHHAIALTMKRHIFSTFQVSLTTGDSKERRHPKNWTICKIFLDHHLLESLIQLNDNSFGSNFAITVGSLENLFHKVEWLPVSSLFNL